MIVLHKFTWKTPKRSCTEHLGESVPRTIRISLCNISAATEDNWVEPSHMDTPDKQMSIFLCEFEYSSRQVTFGITP